MKKPYLVLVNGVLWNRNVTRIGAAKVIVTLQARGLNAVLAYECIAGERAVYQLNKGAN